MLWLNTTCTAGIAPYSTWAKSKMPRGKQPSRVIAACCVSSNIIVVLMHRHTCLHLSCLWWGEPGGATPIHPPSSVPSRACELGEQVDWLLGHSGTCAVLRKIWLSLSLLFNSTVFPWLTYWVAFVFNLVNTTLYQSGLHPSFDKSPAVVTPSKFHCDTVWVKIPTDCEPLWLFCQSVHWNGAKHQHGL